VEHIPSSKADNCFHRRFPVLNGIQMFITFITRAHNWSLSRAKLM
jgi:hypothetical protein